MHIIAHIATQLKLSSNKLEAEAVWYICEGLRGSSSITALDLGANNLGAKGAKVLADGGAFAGSLTQARAHRAHRESVYSPASRSVP